MDKIRAEDLADAMDHLLSGDDRSFRPTVAEIRREARYQKENKNLKVLHEEIQRLQGE